MAHCHLLKQDMAGSIICCPVASATAYKQGHEDSHAKVKFPVNSTQWQTPILAPTCAHTLTHIMPVHQLPVIGNASTRKRASWPRRKRYTQMKSTMCGSYSYCIQCHAQHKLSSNMLPGVCFRKDPAAASSAPLALSARALSGSNDAFLQCYARWAYAAIDHSTSNSYRNMTSINTAMQHQSNPNPH